jgi:prepilin peptidase CpaA
MPLWPDPVLAAWFAFALAAPLFVWAAICDLRRMIIPNRISVLLVAVFIVWAALFLTPEAAIWRAGAGLATLTIGVILVMAARMGGGDMKLLAAAAPFVAPSHAGTAMVLLALCLIALLPPLFAARWMLGRRAATPGWVALRPGSRDVPMGVSIAAAAVLYLFALLPIG